MRELRKPPITKNNAELIISGRPRKPDSGVGGGRRKETQERRICNNKFNHDDVKLMYQVLSCVKLSPADGGVSIRSAGVCNAVSGGVMTTRTT